jgi:hypothetical protein
MWAVPPVCCCPWSTRSRRVPLFNAVNADAAEAWCHVYLQLAAELGAAANVDLGCCSGLITMEDRGG